MKLLIIYPNEVMIPRAPLGLGYISSNLKKNGHEMILFDTTFIKCSNLPGDDELRSRSNQVKNPTVIKQEEVDVFTKLEETLNKVNPDVIGISVVDCNYKLGIALAKHCKNIRPSTKIIAGGPLTTFDPDLVMKEECIDGIGRGECEYTLVDFCNKYDTGGWEGTYNTDNFWIKGENNEVYKNNITIPDITETLTPDLSIYDSRHFDRPLGGKIYKMATVTWTRGCLFNCSYCANVAFYKTANKTPKEYYRITDPKTMVDQLVKIKNDHDINFFMFVDDIWPMNKPEVVKEFCDLYKEKVDLPFSVNLQCTLVKEESFAMAVESGLRNVCIGVESGSPKIRKEILNRRYSDTHLQKAFDLAHKYKIRCSSFNIIGVPTETIPDIMSTIELNKKLKPHSATVSIFHPYRGCSLRKRCIDEKYIEANDDTFEHVYRSESQLKMPQITKEEITNMMNLFSEHIKPAEINWNFNKKTEWWKDD